MSDFLICDCVGYGELILDEVSSNGRVKFRGKFQEANAVNKNKRMYPEAILQREVDRLMGDTVDQRGLMGELDHPTDSVVHLENASHLITKLWWEGNTLMGDGEVLNTPAGKVLQSLIEAGVRVGISSRGVGNGTTNNEGVLVIGESYKLITFDAVADPSTFSAFQKRIDNKDETITAKKILTNSEPKNESQSLHSVNANALISYLGHIVQKYKEDIKERYNNDEPK